jgi:phosphoketolase
MKLWEKKIKSRYTGFLTTTTTTTTTTVGAAAAAAAAALVSFFARFKIKKIKQINCKKLESNYEWHHLLHTSHFDFIFFLDNNHFFFDYSSFTELVFFFFF